MKEKIQGTLWSRPVEAVVGWYGRCTLRTKRGNVVTRFNAGGTADKRLFAPEYMMYSGVFCMNKKLRNHTQRKGERP